MDVNIEKLFEEDFDVALKRSITDNILVATKAYNLFVLDNKDFFDYNNYGSLRGEFLTYCINKQMSAAAFTPRSRYRALDEEVNEYKRGIVHLFTDNFVITVSKTRAKGKLPVKCNYRREYAKVNSGCDGQLRLACVEDKNIDSVISPKYYAIVTYGYNFKIKDCTHIQLLVPDSRYKKVLVYKDLLDEYKKNPVLVDISQQEEKQVAKLNKEMEQLVELKLRKNE